MPERLESYMAKHYIHRSNWLRASVLGANDGIISMASLGIGLASSGCTKESLIMSMGAGLVAGAFSMAAGEYVSVSAQTDIENADIERESKELLESPEQELDILAAIYESRGLSRATAIQVANEMTAHNALAAHVRDELGINENSSANPIQAAFASGMSFTFGGIMPTAICLLTNVDSLVMPMYVITIFFLALLGSISAFTGGSPIWKAIIRITVWGTLAMGASAITGMAF
jgi:VIT1/CCC1 family predicted Fe2+/Mn2+ transporter